MCRCRIQLIRSDIEKLVIEIDSIYSRQSKFSKDTWWSRNIVINISYYFSLLVINRVAFTRPETNNDRHQRHVFSAKTIPMKNICIFIADRYEIQKF